MHFAAAPAMSAAYAPEEKGGPVRKKRRVAPAPSGRSTEFFCAKDEIQDDGLLLAQAVRKAARSFAERKFGSSSTVGFFKTPWYTDNGFCTTVALCTQCTGCKAGDGQTFLFRGAWRSMGDEAEDEERGIELQVQTRGEHAGDPAVLRRKGGSAGEMHLTQGSPGSIAVLSTAVRGTEPSSGERHFFSRPQVNL